MLVSVFQLSKSRRAPLPCQEGVEHLTLEHVALPFNVHYLRILQLTQMKVEGGER